MQSNRTAYEPSHRPKYLVVIDETPECGRALLYAARSCARHGAGLVLLAVKPQMENAYWLGVGEVMRAEAEETAQTVLDSSAALARQITGHEPERVVREGQAAQEIASLIDQDSDIALLVLAAGTGAEGPGPLVSALAYKMASTFPIPIMIIPGILSDEAIHRLA